MCFYPHVIKYLLDILTRFRPILETSIQSYFATQKNTFGDNADDDSFELY